MLQRGKPMPMEFDDQATYMKELMMKDLYERFEEYEGYGDISTRGGEMKKKERKWSTPKERSKTLQGRETTSQNATEA